MVLLPPTLLRDWAPVHLVLPLLLRRSRPALGLASRLVGVCLLVWVARLLVLEVRHLRVDLGSPRVVSLVVRLQVSLDVEGLEDPVSSFALRTDIEQAH